MSLEAECEIVGEAENGLAGIQADEELKPDVVLLDISMPVMDGFLAAESLKSSRPDVHIIFVSQHAERSYIEKAFRVGAEGYVLKTSAAEELITALREVLAGRTFSSFVTPHGPQLAQ
jgi:DNA-binding NarL/FixJ family response regulator